MINVLDSAVVTLLDINQYSDKYPPQLTIEAGATIETLQLNSIKKTKVVIDDNANIGKIIHNGKNYDSIAAFKADV